MHSNYLKSFASPLAALPQPSILANRRGVRACAPRNERDSGDLS
jgi:hypothetical protein